jgi:hypothetical protein
VSLNDEGYPGPPDRGRTERAGHISDPRRWRVPDPTLGVTAPVVQRTRRRASPASRAARAAHEAFPLATGQWVLRTKGAGAQGPPPGRLAAGLFIGMASDLARRSRTLPGWLTIARYVIAVLQLVASFFLPFLLFLLWVLVASIVLLRRATTAAVSSG